MYTIQSSWMFISTLLALQGGGVGIVDPPSFTLVLKNKSKKNWERRVIFLGMIYFKIVPSPEIFITFLGPMRSTIVKENYIASVESKILQYR